ncbi:hypothetical protein GQ55_1G185400 [Panicum hallii var. hallii]|uniref:Uncharacterized protein n=1 Tax=Panicum hallii var. hallii TaxID=1504633 RepID=A0A2T7F655_9POAL|nr:hypothetical protein GQ55_1G185400 [Panicum hallii var. hallii]
MSSMKAAVGEHRRHVPAQPRKPARRRRRPRRGLQAPGEVLGRLAVAVADAHAKRGSRRWAGGEPAAERVLPDRRSAGVRVSQEVPRALGSSAPAAAAAARRAPGRDGQATRGSRRPRTGRGAKASAAGNPPSAQTKGQRRRHWSSRANRTRGAIERRREEKWDNSITAGGERYQVCICCYLFTLPSTNGTVGVSVSLSLNF